MVSAITRYLELPACLLLGLLLCACDYPEGGYYQLTALDGAEQIVWRMPLIVEEITDDTQMTTGFTILLPRDGQLVELPLANGADLRERDWLLSLAAADCAAGDLDLTFRHAAEHLSFSGNYLPVAGGAVYAVAGAAGSEDTPGRTPVLLNGPLPPLPEALAGTVRLELRAITQERFEELLGGPVGQALRVAAQVRDPLPEGTPATGLETAQPAAETEPQPPANPPEEEKPARPKAKPNLGGKRKPR